MRKKFLLSALAAVSITLYTTTKITITPRTLNSINSIQQLDEILKSEAYVVVKFSASWCGPCKAMAPILDQVKNEVGDNASIIKIDVDRNQQIAQSLQIQGVPTLILYKNGKQLWRQSGVVQKEMLVNLLNQHS